MAAVRYRGVVLGLSKLIFLGLSHLPILRAAPMDHPLFRYFEAGEDPEAKPAEDPSKWAYLGTAVALVLLGGAFAGLTIALMGQDEIYLQVIATSGEKAEKKNAQKVLKLLQRGKHWVLVTLLLSNVITNETLPIVLDRSLGGGWPAVLSSTVLIVIFGEIAPQSVCVRYGLPIGAWMSPFVLGLMWLMAPVAFPTARLLDWLLGEDHGTVYKKAGLKTLVTLHKSLGPTPSDRLNEDEVTIISAVLDLKDKSVGSIMTPMSDVFTLSADAVLDENMMDNILSAGYSRIPIHAPDNGNNFVGMLLVKMLITYDPEDSLCVRDFALATLPETRPETSCLDIVNFFQDGKSHMVLVSDFPGDSFGAIGVVTLEDVIEELIGEEIIDESDVFVDVHKAIRRMTPAPRTRVPRGEIVTDNDAGGVHVGSPGQRGESEAGDLARRNGGGNTDSADSQRKSSMSELGKSPKTTTLLLRRRSTGNAASEAGTTPIRSDSTDIRQHLKHLGPSNAASKPKQTRISAVKIKPGTGARSSIDPSANSSAISHHSTPLIPKSTQGSVGQGLVAPGRDAKDGTFALRQGYGTMNAGSTEGVEDDSGVSSNFLTTVDEAPVQEASATYPQPQNSDALGVPHASGSSEESPPESRDTVGSLSHNRSPSRRSAGGVRSGSITENMVDQGGVKKLVLETTSSSDDEDEEAKASGNKDEEDENGGDSTEAPKEKQQNKKKRRKRGGKKNKKGSGGSGESAPLLGD